MGLKYSMAQGSNVAFSNEEYKEGRTGFLSCRSRVVINSITKMALNLSRSSFARPSPFVSKARPSTKLKISCFAPHNSSKVSWTVIPLLKLETCEFYQITVMDDLRAWFQCRKAYTSVMIVPTGVGAAIGGFAGDALPVARALSSVVDCLITHPNV